jgi:serine phosphatase RsbU (regulator of sigma subunit)
MLAMGRIEPVGVDAVVALTATRALWRDAVERLSEPCDALERTNRVLCAGFSKAIQVRCIYVLVDPTTGSLTYGLAGVSPPLVSGGATDAAPPRVGSVLGRSRESAYETGQFELDPGMALVLLSQPMREARNGDKHAFGTARLPELLKPPPEGAAALAETLLVEFFEFTHRSPYAPPEISCMVLERLPMEDA